MVMMLMMLMMMVFLNSTFGFSDIYLVDIHAKLLLPDLQSWVSDETVDIMGNGSDIWCSPPNLDVKTNVVKSGISNLCVSPHIFESSTVLTPFLDMTF